MRKQLELDTRVILEQSEVSADRVTLPKTQLTRDAYERVNEVLSNLGGKWNRSAKAHLFPYDPRPLLGGVLALNEVPDKNPTAFFPTPPKIVEAMIQATNLEGFTAPRVLEPSAGTGAIARAIMKAAPDAALHCCEVLEVNRSALAAQGFDVVAEDFTTYEPEAQYDAVLMNPPFSVEGDKTAYITHFYRAWSMLREGGVMAAITPMGWLTNSTKAQTAFREFVCDQLSFEAFEPGEFKDSGTMVGTYMVYGEKRPTPWRTHPHSGYPSYHAWNLRLWLDNDYELSRKMEQAQTREEHDEAANRAAEDLRRRGEPVIIRQPDLDDLWSRREAA